MTELSGGVIPANTGVIIEASAATYVFLYTSSTGTDISSLNLLQGSVGESSISEGSYGLGIVDGVVGFYQISDNKNAAGKAYIPASVFAGTGAKCYTFDNKTMSIKNIKAAVNGQKNKYYNTNGIEVNRPTQGLYIQNGQKVYIK